MSGIEKKIKQGIIETQKYWLDNINNVDTVGSPEELTLGTSGLAFLRLMSNCEIRKYPVELPQLVNNWKPRLFTGTHDVYIDTELSDSRLVGDRSE